MRTSFPRRNLLALAALAALALPCFTEAGQFVITGTSRAIIPSGTTNTHVRVLGEAWASYAGILDPTHTHWSINAHVRDNSFGGFVVGNGKQGVGITQGMMIHCDPNICGGDASIARCDLYGNSNTFTVRGAVATFKSNGSAIINNALRSPESVLCFPELPRPEPDEEGASPLIIDLDRNGFHLSGLDHPVLFDIDADGELEMISWTAGDQLDGFLAIDHNGNGRIDNGAELFGNHSWLVDGSRATHGYVALAQYDTFVSGGDQDRAIDSDDLVFDLLRVWIDRDHDGQSDPGELLTLAEAGITRLELDYKEKVRVDQHGNRLVYKSRTWADSGAQEVRLKTTDVFFVLAQGSLR